MVVLEKFRDINLPLVFDQFSEHIKGYGLELKRIDLQANFKCDVFDIALFYEAMGWDKSTITEDTWMDVHADYSVCKGDHLGKGETTIQECPDATAFLMELRERLLAMLSPQIGDDAVAQYINGRDFRFNEQGEVLFTFDELLDDQKAEVLHANRNALVYKGWADELIANFTAMVREKYGIHIAIAEEQPIFDAEIMDYKLLCDALEWSYDPTLKAEIKRERCIVSYKEAYEEGLTELMQVLGIQLYDALDSEFDHRREDAQVSEHLQSIGAYFDLEGNMFV
jgi:hypothetical protein